MKEGVRDARLFHWVADEMGIDAPFPCVLQIDSKQAHSFRRDTCPKSFKTRLLILLVVTACSLVSNSICVTPPNLKSIVPFKYPASYLIESTMP